jgi:hypothetical protein
VEAAAGCRGCTGDGACEFQRVCNNKACMTVAARRSLCEACAPRCDEIEAYDRAVDALKYVGEVNHLLVTVLQAVDQAPNVPAVPLADEPPAAVAHEVPRVAGPARAGRRRSTPRRWLSPAQKKVLLAWVRTHKEHCYPTPDEKVGLSQATGLGLQQVTHWFVNFRKRSPDFKAAWDRN